MSYNTPEISNQGGRPVALYEFRYGNSYWRYTTNDEDLEVGVDENDDPAVWTAMAIKDEGVTQGGSDQNDLQMQIAANTPVAALFRVGRPSGKVWLNVRRYHLGDPDEETPIQWVGTATNAVLIDRATVTLHCRSIAGSYDRNGLRLTWDRNCPHVLYAPYGCRVNKEDHQYPREIATLGGDRFTCTVHAEPAEGSFSGGFLEWTRDDGSFDRLGIESQVGNDFRVLGNTIGLDVGTAITLYPGCNRTTTVCKLFDNLKNYGGFPHLPGKSPFDGSPVF